MQPMGDEAVLVHWSCGITPPKRIFPDCQRTHYAEYALNFDNANQEQVNHAKVEIAYKFPTTKEPNPNNRDGCEIEQHHDYVQDQYDIGQAGEQETH
jgi:hypothetical protein